MTSEIDGPIGYVEWRPNPSLDRYVACSWTGGLESKARGSAEPVLPDGCMDVIWDGSRLFVAGPDTGPNPATQEGRFVVGLRFRPGIAPAFFGVPASALRDQRVDLEEFWPHVDRLNEDLAGTSSLRQAAAVLEAEVAGRLFGLRAPDPLVETASRLWRTGAAPGGTTWLSDRAGISERQLHRRFVAAVGYGPKMLQRVLRFQAFLAACGQPGVGLAELAARSSYSDQSHLTREARALSGLTPARLRAARLNVRNVQDAHAA